MSLGVTVVLQAALLTVGGDSYAEAHKATTEKGCPLVVVVGATWCPACQQLKKDVLPEVKRHGVLRNVAFAEVDLDEERELGSELTEGGPIPQIVVYRHTPLGWRLRRLIGGQDVRTVEQFILQGVRDDDKDKAGADSPKKPPEKQTPAQAKPIVHEAKSKPTTPSSKG